MIGFLIQYRHFIGYGLAVVALGFAVWYIHHEGYKACERDAMEKTIDVVEKRNEIANNPATVDILRKRLLDNSY